jgi:hypothetical protein
MADRIIGLLKNPVQASTMGKLARHTVEQNFSCDAQLANTEALYERLLARCLRDSSPDADIDSRSLTAKIDHQSRRM